MLRLLPPQPERRHHHLVPVIKHHTARSPQSQPHIARVPRRRMRRLFTNGATCGNTCFRRRHDTCPRARQVRARARGREDGGAGVEFPDEGARVVEDQEQFASVVWEAQEGRDALCWYNTNRYEWRWMNGQIYIYFSCNGSIAVLSDITHGRQCNFRFNVSEKTECPTYKYVFLDFALLHNCSQILHVLSQSPRIDTKLILVPGWGSACPPTGSVGLTFCLNSGMPSMCLMRSESLCHRNKSPELSSPPMKCP